MAIKKAVQIGNTMLRTVCTDVSIPLDNEIENVIGDLVDTMRSMGLVGLSAPQLGFDARVFVMELRPNPKTGRKGQSELFVCINPRIVSYSKEEESGWEGCGSIARGALFGKLVRSVSVELEYSDEMGITKKKSFEGLLARVLQHEVDHLNGVLFIDRMDDPKNLYDIEEYQRLRKKVMSNR